MIVLKHPISALLARGALRSSVAAAVLVTALGCDGPPITEPEVTGDVRSYVTGAAASSLDGAGRFVFPGSSSPTSLPIITAERALALAKANLQTWGPSFKAQWEVTHGGPIDLSRLQADPRILYLSTPYQRVPDGFHRSYTRSLGPHYLIRMLSGRRTVLFMGIAAYTTEVAIDSGGYINRPPFGRGAEFLEHVMPIDTTLLRLYTPEDAVVLVGRSTGARVTEVPELVRRKMPLSPTVSLWKLTLDRSVRVRTVQGSRVAEVREIYVSPETRARLLIPSLEQPASYRTMAFLDGTGDAMAALEVAVTHGVSTEFEPVVLVGS